VRFEAQRGASARQLAVPETRLCPYCHQPFLARDPQTVKCKKPQCRREYKKRIARTYADKHGLYQPRETAPALKTACDALEAQLTAENRPHWRAIIEAFTTPNVPGYRDLGWLTRACVTAKRHLT